MIGQAVIDYFKLFKIFDLKKLEKTGQVKIVQDKILMRKVLSAQGTVSTENFTTLNCTNHPNIQFRQQYLYLLAYCQPGKSLNFQLTYLLANKQYKVICSTMYKEEFKKKSDTIFHYQIKMPSGKWTLLAIDIYSLANWDNSFKKDQDIRLGFRMSSIQIRSTTKIKGIFQSQSLFGPHNLPKQMQYPLQPEQNFFEKYAYAVMGLNLSEELKHEIELNKQKLKQNELKYAQKELKNDPQLSSKQILSSEKQVIEKIKKNVSQEKTSKLSKSNVKVNKKQSKQPKKQKNFEIDQGDDNMMEDIQLIPPKPASSVHLSFSSIQALSVVQENIVACQSFLIQPVKIETHKKITHIYKSRLGKVLTSYIDGTISLWDTIRKQSLFYFKSELDEIKCIIMDFDQNMVIVGLDKLKREVIEIVSDKAIVFKQISNFNIKNIKLLTQETFEMGLISFGYENIRIWTISPNNNIINGHSIYLGKTARNVTYLDCCIVDTIAGIYAFVCDSEGYVTKVNINEKKMEGVVRVDTVQIDHIRLIHYVNNQQKILICNQKGTIKLLNSSTMESQLQFPLNQRVKSLFFKNEDREGTDVPILLLQTFKKTLAELDIVKSIFHFNIRSHSQQISNLVFEKYENKICQNDKIITSGLDSTLRIWKRIKISEQQSIFKQQYEFLINAETITHLVSSFSNKNNKQYVFIVTDSLKIRKINCKNYEIVLEKYLQKSNETKNPEVLSFSINSQGKILLVVLDSHFLLLNEELEIFEYKMFSDTNKIISKKKHNNYYSKLNTYHSGFNTIKKSFYLVNPMTFEIEFYKLTNLQSPHFTIHLQEQETLINIEYIDHNIHILTKNQYLFYQNQNLIKILPLQIAKNTRLNTSVMSYPLVCRNFTNIESNDSYLEIIILSKPGLTEFIKMPEQISHIKISKPTQSQSRFDWFGEIVCSGSSSFGLYVIKYSILNFGQNLLSIQAFEDNQNIDIDEMNLKNISFMNDNRAMLNNNFQNQNQLEISFSDVGTIISKYQIGKVNPTHSKFQDHKITKPAELKKIYEQQEKLFQQCKQAVFGNFFDKQRQENQNQIEDEDKVEQSNDYEQINNKHLKMKLFYGFELKQSLTEDEEKKKEKEKSINLIGDFYWNTGFKLMNLLTNQSKSILSHQFLNPRIKQRLIHFYEKPTSICWSEHLEQSLDRVNYYIVCLRSIIKLYNINNKMSFIRNIENEAIMKDNHTIFSSFITNCNGFLVILTYKQKQNQQRFKENEKFDKKLFIFVIQLSTGKIVSSSYRQVKSVPIIKTYGEYIWMLKKRYYLTVNRYIANRQLQFMLTGPNQVAFYRVNSMFALQTLDLNEINLITKEKTENLTTTQYIKVENNVYILIGSQNGSLIIIDSRSGSIALILMNIVSNSSQQISGIEFIPQQNIEENDQTEYLPSKLIIYTNCNNIKVFILQNGLNSLIQDNEHLDQGNSQIFKTIMLDGQIISKSEINNKTQQLIITRSATLWLVDYQDYCTIKILSCHSANINEMMLLMNCRDIENINQHYFISCSQDGYVKVSDTAKAEQIVEIYKPRKNATCLQVSEKFIACGFQNQLYFYTPITEKQEAKNLSYLGSLQFEDEIILKTRNIFHTDNFYVLTNKKCYIIYVKQKQIYQKNKSNILQGKSQFSTISNQSKLGLNSLQKILIEIQICQIATFITNDQNSVSNIPLNIQINPYRPYDEMCICFKNGRIETWERKCLKRTLNPLEQLSKVRELSYYLIDAYQKKDNNNPQIDFISETQYILADPQRCRLQIRNYKEHSIIQQITLMQGSIQRIKCFKYLESIDFTRFNNIEKGKNVTNYSKKGSKILIGDEYGYLSIYDLNGFLVEKQKIFFSSIESISIKKQEIKENKIVLGVKSLHYASVYEINNY